MHLIALFFILGLTPCWSQADHFRFERIGLGQGLSQSTVTCLLQDRKGFLWVGTNDGLNRFDDYQFKHYTSVPPAERLAAAREG